MDFYEAEMRRLFDGNRVIREAKFIGKTMLGKLDDELRVKLQFLATFVHGHYDAIQAIIINRTDGEVDRQLFRFSDMIGKQSYGGGEISPYIWDDGKPEWYVPVSDTDMKTIADTILDYVGMYSPEETEEINGMKMR